MYANKFVEQENFASKLISKVDIEMECIGMDDEQLERFFSREMTPSEKELLMSYLRNKTTMWAMAHIPLISTILCLLWKAKGAKSAKEALGTSENDLYTKMTHYIWERYSGHSTFPQGKPSKVYQGNIVLL